MRTLLSLSIGLALASANSLAESLPHELTGWTALPSTARWAGPTSGQLINGVKGVSTPFVAEQPIPGWSGLLANSDGTYLAMPDNGYGSKANSGDYLLGYYTISPSFKTAGDGTTNPGLVTNNAFVAFNDANGFLNDGKGVDLQITADFTNYQTMNGAALVDSGIAVDSTIASKRLLTGFDFDIESVARGSNGTLWVGEEFGPYLLQFDAASGTLLRDPVAHPYLKSPFNPEVLSGVEAATLGGSRGFESLAANGNGSLLYAVPEAAPSVDALRPVPGDERVLDIFEFDPEAGAYTDNVFKYMKDGNAVRNGVVIGDMTHVADDKYILIERDGGSGVNAQIKRLYMIDLNVTDADGILIKRLVLDLLDINDPQDIGGPLPNLEEGKFNLPFDSIENVVMIDPYTLGVAIDTNYPFEDGRTCTTSENCGWAYPTGIPDNTEFVTIRFEQPLASAAVPVPAALPLFLSAFAGLSLYGRRRQSA